MYYEAKGLRVKIHADEIANLVFLILSNVLIQSLHSGTASLWTVGELDSVWTSHLIGIDDRKGHDAMKQVQLGETRPNCCLY